MATKLDKEVSSDEKMLPTKSYKPSITGEAGHIKKVLYLHFHETCYHQTWQLVAYDLELQTRK